jgi:hypothetical protein
MMPGGASDGGCSMPTGSIPGGGPSGGGSTPGGACSGGGRIALAASESNKNGNQHASHSQPCVQPVEHGHQQATDQHLHPQQENPYSCKGEPSSYQHNTRIHSI